MTDERSPSFIASARGYRRMVRALVLAIAIVVIGWLYVVGHFVVKFW